jgi:DNA (cytosine-5)-methyltransferase 1
MKTFKFIDLFAGVGGFHQAMESLGGECVFASDIDAKCRETYQANYNLEVNDDITKVEPNEVPAHNVICAGFPCQAFSKAGKRLGVLDPRGTLFFDVIRIAEHHRPEYMLLENVRNLVGHDGGMTWKTIYNTIIELGYYVSEIPTIFSPNYIGIPQHRERVFIMCIRKDLGEIPEFHFNKDNKKECSVEDILLNDNEISNLSEYKISESETSIIELWNEFIQNINAPFPGFPVWANRLKELDFDENLEILPDWKKTFILKNNDLYLKNRDFLDKWLLRAWKNPNFKGSKAMFEWQAGQTANPDIWKTIMQFRPSGLRVKKGTHFPALVAITQTSILGSRKRRLTPLECGRLQSFSSDFKFHTKDSVSYKQLGNSVNVELVRLFARFLFGDEDIRREYSYNNQYKKSLSLF